MNSVETTVLGGCEESDIPDSYSHQFVETILKMLKIDGREVSVVFTDDETIARLNREYRDREGPTDVLSFSQDEQNGDEPAGWPAGVEENSSLGDIIISVETLAAHALLYCVPAEEELNRLLVHGMLHLLGYDHETNHAGEPMLKLQEELLLKAASEKPSNGVSQ
jgi:probable rRNA maturation factor